MRLQQHIRELQEARVQAGSPSNTSSAAPALPASSASSSAVRRYSAAREMLMSMPCGPSASITCADDVPRRGRGRQASRTGSRDAPPVPPDRDDRSSRGACPSACGRNRRSACRTRQAAAPPRRSVPGPGCRRACPRRARAADSRPWPPRPDRTQFSAAEHAARQRQHHRDSQVGDIVGQHVRRVGHLDAARGRRQDRPRHSQRHRR